MFSINAIIPSKPTAGHVAVISYKGFDISMTTATMVPELVIFDNNGNSISEFHDRNVTPENITAAAAFIDKLYEDGRVVSSYTFVCAEDAKMVNEALKDTPAMNPKQRFGHW